MPLIVLLISLETKAQSSIVNTERNFHRIDSVFHIFSDFMFDIKKGNIDMTILRSNITMGSKFGKNLLRLTGAYNENNLNDNKIIKSVSYQIRYNRMHLNNNSFFVFIQNGEDFRTFIDQRFLIGGGYRIHIFRKKSDYFDVATGFMREFEKIPFIYSSRKKLQFIVCKKNKIHI